MPNITKKLTADQRSDLKQMVKTFRENEDSFRENCEIIYTIQDQELWVEDADTFKEFCEKILGITRQRGYQMAETGKFLSSDTTNEFGALENEAQATALAKVPKKRRKQVLAKATENGESPTAKRIEEADEEVSGSSPFIENRITKEAEEFEDAIGVVKDESLRPVFTDGEKLFKDILKQLKQAKADAEFLAGDKKFGHFLNWQSLEAAFENVMTPIKFCAPYAVCCYCHAGQGKSGCKACKGQGWLSMGLYKAADKALREMAEKKRAKK